MRKPHLAHRPRRKKHEEHANHEAWAIPYADLLTLLLAFFVVMYAISSVNAGKYRVLSDSLFAAFRGAPRTMEPIQVGEKQVGSGADIQTTIVQQSMLDGQPRSILAVKADPGNSKETGNPPVTPKVGPQLSGTAAAASQALQKVADQVEQAMDDLVKDNLVVVRRSDFWIEVEIKTDILFPSGSAHLGTNATSVLERLAASLAPFPNPIRVEGYTDNLPIKNLQFYSNWELSAARAGSVVRVLAGRGVDPGRLAVIGYGEQRPLQSNDTVQGRNANRRVVIVILSTQLQHKQDDSGVPAATAANAAVSGAEGGNVPGALSSDPAPVAPAAMVAPTPASTATAAPGTAPAPTLIPTQASPPNEAPVRATLAVPGEPAIPPGRTVPGARATPAPIGQPALPGRPAPAPQAVPAVRGTGPSTTSNTLATQHPAT
jgi:chemotaxis protein MotB